MSVISQIRGHSGGKRSPYLAALFLPVLLAGCQKGCPTYLPISGKILVAHAGGGLPGVDHPNNVNAMSTAYRHGLRLIELDFQERGGKIILAHHRPTSSASSFAEVLEWLERHPDATIITDFKTDNISGLTLLAREAGPLRKRFIPQIYQPSEFSAVQRLGLQPPILTLYKIREPWRTFADEAEIQAVTMPHEHVELARGITKPVFLHTVNAAVDHPVAGYYTDCLIPAGASP